MTEEIVAGEGAEDPGDAPELHENGGDPLPDDPDEEEPEPETPVTRMRTGAPPDPRRGR